MKENKIHAYLISYKIDQGTYYDIKNVVVIAYTKKEAIEILNVANAYYNDIAVDFNEKLEKIGAIISIQALRKNKQNAHWFTLDAYQTQGKAINYIGK